MPNEDGSLTQDELRNRQIRARGNADPDPRFMADLATTKKPAQPRDERNVALASMGFSSPQAPPTTPDALPVNSTSGFTPPPTRPDIDVQRGVEQLDPQPEASGAHRAGEATTEAVGGAVRGVGNAVANAGLARISAGEARNAGFTNAFRGVRDFARGVVGADPIVAGPPLPTPATDLLRERLAPDTRGGDKEAGAPPNTGDDGSDNDAGSRPFPSPGHRISDSVDVLSQLPGAIPRGDGAVDVTGVSQSDFSDPANVPAGIDRAIGSQAQEQGDPGQQSDGEVKPTVVEAPPTKPLDRVRIHRGIGAGSKVTDAIVNNPASDQFLAGLEGPAGLNDEDLITMGKLRNQGIKGEDAQNLLLRQKQVQAELMRAGASELNARANAMGWVDTQEGRRIFYQTQPGGGVSFLDTDITALQEPKVGNFVTDNGLTKTSTPSLLYPQINAETGQPDPALTAAMDMTKWGIEAGDRDSDRFKAIMEITQAAKAAGKSAQELQEELDKRFAE